jgi:tRNA (mo5U34)-methyltransferase
MGAPGLAGTRLQERIDELAPWFHNLDLDGIKTAPQHFLGDYPSFKWQTFERAMPQDLTGRTVLDIGCNAGFYALEMKRRGAARVVAIDSDPRYLRQAELASQVCGLPIVLRRMSVYEIESLGERFDIVLFMGVLYHLRHPLLALDLIRAHVADDVLVFQSLQRGEETVAALEADYPFEEDAIFHRPGMPRMQFVEHWFARDPTNWWVPNRACMEAMLRSAGFSIESHPAQDVYVCRIGERDPYAEPPPTIAPASSGDGAA